MPSKAINGVLRHHLDELGYRVPTGPRHAGGWSLKDRLLLGSADLRTTATNVIEAELALQGFADSLRNDWCQGAKRVQRHDASLAVLGEARNTPRAWVVVTAYYSAFFAANELARAMGRFSIYFDEDATNQLRAQSVGSHDLEHGTYAGVVLLSPGGVMLRLRKAGGRPHVLAWRVLSEQGAGLLRRASSEAITRIFLRFIGAAQHDGATWPLPSVTRNQWNYGKPDLYGKAGDELAKNMASILHNRDAAYKWCRARRMQKSDANIVASIAFVRHVLREAFDLSCPLFGASVAKSP